MYVKHNWLPLKSICSSKYYSIKNNDSRRSDDIYITHDIFKNENYFLKVFSVFSDKVTSTIVIS